MPLRKDPPSQGNASSASGPERGFAQRLFKNRADDAASLRSFQTQTTEAPSYHTRIENDPHAQSPYAAQAHRNPLVPLVEACRTGAQQVKEYKEARNKRKKEERHRIQMEHEANVDAYFEAKREKEEREREEYERDRASRPDYGSSGYHNTASTSSGYAAGMI